jgi:hypothetical protein
MALCNSWSETWNLCAAREQLCCALRLEVRFKFFGLDIEFLQCLQLEILYLRFKGLYVIVFIYVPDSGRILVI